MFRVPLKREDYVEPSKIGKLFGVLSLIVFLIAPGRVAVAQVLLTDSLATWQAAAPGFVNVVSGYGSASTALGGGSVSYDPGTVVTVGVSWATWCCGYTGQAIWAQGATSTHLTFSGLGAFGVEVEPDLFQVESITVTLSDGQSITDDVNGNAGAQFFGFVGDGITSMTITINAQDDFAFGDFYALPAASKVTVAGADLVNNTVTVQLSGPTSSSGTLTLTANGISNNYAAITPANPVGPGTYEVTFDRPHMPVDTYTSITAKWNVSPAPLSTNFALANEWVVLGVIRHSQYNTPLESQCGGSSALAWVFDSSCHFTKTVLNAQFMRQVYVNGTGQSQSHGILKYSNPSGGGRCASSYPPGATSHNTFLEVSSVTGACGTVLAGGTSVATYPSPNLQTTYTCGDAILLITSADSNLGVKEADDYCPACKMGFNGTLGHIDDYSSVAACTASGVGDLGNFWTANTHGEKQ